MRLRLLAWGIVVAAVAVAAVVVKVPGAWPMQPTRADEMRASVKVLEGGGPPLVGETGDASGFRFEPIGDTDDPGLYLYGPLAAEALGSSDPVDLVKWAFLIAWFGVIALAPLAWARALGSPHAGILPPVMMAPLPLAAALGAGDIYWVGAWVTLAAAPLLVAARRRNLVHPTAVFAVIAAVCGVVSSVRGYNGLPTILAAAGLAAWMLRPRLKGVTVAAALIAVYAVAWLGPLALARDQRADWASGKPVAPQSAASHPIWHSVYIGLGYAPNDLGIRYLDEYGIARVKRDAPSAAYLSPEYGEALRDAWLDYVRANPARTAVLELRKAATVVMFSAPFLVLLALMVAAMRRMRWLRSELGPDLVLLVPALGLFSLLPLAVVPLFSYELPFLGACIAASTLALAFASAKIGPRLAEGGRAATAAMFRDIQRAPGARATIRLGTGLACLVLVVASLGFVAYRSFLSWNDVPAPPAGTGQETALPPAP